MPITEELKEKVHKCFSEQKFIGAIEYSENEYQELLAYTRRYSRTFAYGVGSLLNGDDEIHFATLVEIAKRWKNDDDGDKGFWRYVFQEVINGGNNQKLYNAYTSLIHDLANRKKILLADTAKVYYATIMMHAFAPCKSLNAFFDFVYNIYKKDLDFDYTDVDREICDVAADGFCNVAQSIGGRNVDVSIGSGVYGIKIGLRCMALGSETREYFVALLDKVLSLINALYHRNDLPDDYLSHSLKKWWEAKAEKEACYTDIRRVPATTRQNIDVRFVCKNDEVFLCVPPIRFGSGETPNLWLSVYVSGRAKPIIAREIFTRVGEITVTSVEQDIDLNSILRETTRIKILVRVTENGQDIFNKTIDKEFLLFDNEKEITNKILKVGNYFVYSLSVDEMQTPTAISAISKNLYNIYPAEGEILSGEQRQIIFTNNIDGGGVSNKIQLLGASAICKWKYKNVTYKVFTNRINLMIPRGAFINGFELRVDENGTLLSDLSYVVEDENYIFDITELIPERIPCKAVVYSHFKEKEVVHEDLVLIRKLHIGFSAPIYYGDEVGQVRVNVGSHYRDLTWQSGEDTVACVLCKGELAITVPIFKWRVDAGEWHYGPIKDIIWYKDVFNSGSVLEVNAPVDINTIKLYCIGDGAIQEIPINNASRFEIGRFIFANEGRKTLAFFFRSNEGVNRYEICETTTIEHFTRLPFTIENNKMQFIGERVFIGCPKKYFNIHLKRIGRDEIDIKSSDLSDGVLDGVDEGLYWIRVSAPSGVLFTIGEKIFWEGEFVFGDADRLKLSNILLKIKPICGIGSGDFWKTTSSGYYVSDLVREDDADMYSAKLYYKDANGRRSDVNGFSQCRIAIISPIALQLQVKDGMGNYAERLKCDAGGNLYDPKASQKFFATNYNFIEVKNV